MLTSNIVCHTRVLSCLRTPASWDDDARSLRRCSHLLSDLPSVAGLPDRNRADGRAVAAAAAIGQPQPAPIGTLAQRGSRCSGLSASPSSRMAIGRSRGSRGVPVARDDLGIRPCSSCSARSCLCHRACSRSSRPRSRSCSISARRAGGWSSGTWSTRPLPVTSPDGKTEIGRAQIAFRSSPFSRAADDHLLLGCSPRSLYHLGILTWVVHGLAWLMQKTMGTSGAETLSTAAEHLRRADRSAADGQAVPRDGNAVELMAIMVGGFANIASGVLVVYTRFLAGFRPRRRRASRGRVLHLRAGDARRRQADGAGNDTSGDRGRREVQGRAHRRQPVRRRHRGTTEGLALALNVARDADHVHRAGRDAQRRLITVGIGRARAGTSSSRWTDPRLPLRAARVADAGWNGTTAPRSVAAGHEDGAERVHRVSRNEPRTSEAIRTFSRPARRCSRPTRCAASPTSPPSASRSAASARMAPSGGTICRSIGLLAMVGGAIASLMGACVVGVLW